MCMGIIVESVSQDFMICLMMINRILCINIVMVRRCNGICHRSSVGKAKDGSWYTTTKRCHLCQKFFALDVVLCPCCKSRLRTKSRR